MAHFGNLQYKNKWEFLISFGEVNFKVEVEQNIKFLVTLKKLKVKAQPNDSELDYF